MQSQLPLRVSDLRRGLAGRDPTILAANTGTIYQYTGREQQGEFTLHVWDKPATLSWPDLITRDGVTTETLRDDLQALVLYYFTTADGTPEAGRRISFSELPGGKFYNQAFQGYSGDELAKHFGQDLAAFERAALSCQGKPVTFADCAYAFRALPRLELLVTYWQGDEDFRASMQVLFDASASHYLPTDVCAVLGGTLARRLIRA
jgi:hypothetical protein